MQIIDVIEVLGISVFALSGAVAAMRKKLDVFGVLIITFVTSIGGGTIRDLLMGSLPVAWILDLEVILTISTVYFISLFFHQKLIRFKHIMFWSDTIGLAVFCMVAVDKAIGFELHPIVCIALGTVTGTFGGIIRDVLLNEIPYVFRKDIYASTCIAGGSVFFIFLFLGFNQDASTWIGGLTIVFIRIGAFYFKWRLPLIYGKAEVVEEDN